MLCAVVSYACIVAAAPLVGSRDTGRLCICACTLILCACGCKVIPMPPAPSHDSRRTSLLSCTMDWCSHSGINSSSIYPSPNVSSSNWAKQIALVLPHNLLPQYINRVQLVHTYAYDNHRTLPLSVRRCFHLATQPCNPTFLNLFCALNTLLS